MGGLMPHIRGGVVFVFQLLETKRAVVYGSYEFERARPTSSASERIIFGPFRGKYCQTTIIPANCAWRDCRRPVRSL